MATIFCDIDDVLLSLVPQWIQYYNDSYNDDLTIDKITDWDIAQFAKSEARDTFYDVIQWPDIFDAALPVDGAIEGVNYLKSLGHRIVFATATNPENIKEKWLKRYGLLTDEKDFVHIVDKSLLRGNLLIDDNFSNVSNFVGKAILATRNWNKKYDYFFRASDWKDIVALVEAML